MYFILLACSVSLWAGQEESVLLPSTAGQPNQERHGPEALPEADSSAYSIQDVGTNLHEALPVEDARAKREVVPPSNAQVSQNHAPKIQADRFSFEQFGKIMVARGEASRGTQAWFCYRNNRIDADEIRYDRDAGQIIASGKVRFTNAHFRFLTDALVIDLNAGTLSSESFRMGSRLWYIEGEALSGTLDLFEMQSASLYYMGPQSLTPRLHFERVCYSPKKGLSASRVSLRAGSLPILAWRNFKSPLKAPKTRLEGRVGQRKRLGAFLQTETLFPLGEALQLGPILDYYSQYGYLLGLGAAMHYTGARLESQNRMRLAGVIPHDRSNEADQFGQTVSKNRYFIDSKGYSGIGERVQFTHAIRARSDSEVMRDFRPELYAKDPFSLSHAELVYAQNDYSVSALLEKQFNDFEYQVEQLPSLRADWFSKKIGDTRLYNRSFMQAMALKERNVGADSHRDYKKAELFSELSLPHATQGGFFLKPSLAVRLAGYDPDQRANSAQAVGELGLRVGQRFYRDWDWQSKAFNVSGLTHHITPSIDFRQYRVSKQARLERSFMQSSNRPNLPSIELGSMRGIEDLEDQEVLRLGLENCISVGPYSSTTGPQSSSGTGDYRTQSGSRAPHAAQLNPALLYRDWAQLNIYQDIRTRSTGLGHLSDFYTQFKFSPAYWLDVESAHRFDPDNDFRLRELNNAVVIKEARDWSLRFNSLILKDETLSQAINQYGFDGHYRFNEALSARAQFKLDAKRHTLVSQHYTLSTCLNSVWKIDWQLGFLEKTDRNPSRFHVGVNVALIYL